VEAWSFFEPGDLDTEGGGTTASLMNTGDHPVELAVSGRVEPPGLRIFLTLLTIMDSRWADGADVLVCRLWRADLRTNQGP
jgi:hypothetical protein